MCRAPSLAASMPPGAPTHQRAGRRGVAGRRSGSAPCPSRAHPRSDRRAARRDHRPLSCRRSYMSPRYSAAPPATEPATTRTTARTARSWSETSMNSAASRTPATIVTVVATATASTWTRRERVRNVRNRAAPATAAASAPPAASSDDDRRVRDARATREGEQSRDDGAAHDQDRGARRSVFIAPTGSPRLAPCTGARGFEGSTSIFSRSLRTCTVIVAVSPTE